MQACSGSLVEESTMLPIPYYTTTDCIKLGGTLLHGNIHAYLIKLAGCALEPVPLVYH